MTHAVARLPFTYNAARANQTTEQIAEQLPKVLDRRPKVVTVLAGINNIRLDGSLTIASVVEMVATIRGAAATPVIATLPPYMRQPERLYAFNTQLREFAERNAVALLDFFQLLEGRYLGELSDDGLHPNLCGAQVMGTYATPVLRAALS